jgi:SET domain
MERSRLLGRKRRRRRSVVSLACLSLFIAAVDGNDHLGDRLLPTLESEDHDSTTPLRHQRPSGASAADTADDNTTPKVVLRPRTRIKLDDENHSGSQPALQPIHPKKITGAAPIPMALPRKVAEPLDRVGYYSDSTGSFSNDNVVRTSNASLAGSVGYASSRKNGRPVSDREKLDIKRDESDYMNWCKQVLGITSILEIQTFAYNASSISSSKPDWESDMTAPSYENATNSTLRNSTQKTQNWTVAHIRGLAASRDIDVGQTVIRVPLQALFSVATSIDHDPVLSSVVGPEQRRAYGWEDGNGEMIGPASSPTGSNETNSEHEEEQHFYELPLLAVALLHHRRLGSASPIAPYIRILIRAPVDSMPFLWSANRLRESVSEGVRIVARGIRQEIKIMYERVMQVLIKNHPEIFGPLTAIDSTTGEWMFSHEMFQWAFAIVNSRHWQLPIEDLTATAVHRPHAPAPNVEDQVPPAQKPTDAWVAEHGDVDDDLPQKSAATYLSGGKDDSTDEYANGDLPAIYHSFLAPVADLLNFGPPCTRVNYDKSTRAFEIIATCAFKKGQEVTFWYSNECSDVMIGVYGFSHPLVPACKSSEEWRLRADTLEEELKDAYDDLKLLEEELEYVEAKLVQCGNGHGSRLRHEEPTKSESGDENRKEMSRRPRRRSSKDSQRIRRTWSQKTEF